jgi:hypothetical protein
MTEKITLPENHVEFCKALARVAREYGIDNLNGSYSPGWKDPWPNNITFSWSQGRHGADADKIWINSSVDVRAKVDPEPPAVS